MVEKEISAKIPAWIKTVRSPQIWIALVVLLILSIIVNWPLGISITFTIIIVLIPAKLFLNDYPERMSAKSIEQQKKVRIVVGRVEARELDEIQANCKICTKKTNQKRFYVYSGFDWWPLGGLRVG